MGKNQSNRSWELSTQVLRLLQSLSKRFNLGIGYVYLHLNIFNKAVV